MTTKTNTNVKKTVLASALLTATIAGTVAPAVANAEPEERKTLTAGSTITVSETETIKNNAETHLEGNTVTTEAAPTLQGAVSVQNIKVALAETPEEGAKKGGATVGWGAKAQAIDKQNLTGAQDATASNATAPTLAVVPLTTRNGWKPSWGVLGQDVSNHQPNINWSAQYAGGSRFSWMKTSEGTTYVDPTFSRHYTGARDAGLVTGGYHFALPSQSSGRTQAEIFIKNGGGWTADGKTLPGMLDLEYNPYPSLGNTCFGMSQSQLKAWTWDFMNTYKEKTGRYPTIYSTTDWWNTCMGGTGEFKAAPLHIANYSTGPGYMPGGSTSFDIWQFSSVAPFAGDSNVFNGTTAELDNFVRNPNYVSKWQSNGKVSPSPVTDRSAVPEQPKPEPAKDNGDRHFNNGGYINIYSGIGSYWHKDEARYGTPIGRELALPRGWAQDFTNGYRILHRKDGKGGAIKLNGAIGDLWVKGGNEYGRFGYPLTDEYSFRESVQQDFDSGKKLIWSAKNGVHVMTNFEPIITKWFSLGDVRGVGTPITDEVTNGDVIHQDFRTDDGYKITRISWNTRTNAVTVTNANEVSSNGFVIKNGIREYLNRLGTDYGGAAGNERTIDAQRGVWEQDFKSGHRVVYSYGAQGKSVWTRGAIGNRWVQAGGSAGTYKYPTSEELTKNGYTYQDFGSGHKMVWTERTGVHNIWMPGAIGHYWEQHQNEIGVPISEETSQGNGVVTQDFLTKDGRTVKLVWTEQTGVHSIDINSAIARKWLSYGEVGKSKLGVPVSEEYYVHGGRAQDFKNGDDYYIVGWDASANRTHVIQFNSEVGKKWAREGHWDKHGFPVSDVVGNRNATTQWFSRTGKISTIATGHASVRHVEPASLAAEPLVNQQSNNVKDKIVATAKSGLGGTYVWGGKTFKSWDCSGFVSWVYAQHGIKLTPYTFAMKNELKPTTTPQPGDIVFQNGYNHVGIYLGEGKMISALNPSSGTLIHPTSWMPVDGYFTTK